MIDLSSFIQGKLNNFKNTVAQKANQGLSSISNAYKADLNPNVAGTQSIQGALKLNFNPYSQQNLKAGIYSAQQLSQSKNPIVSTYGNFGRNTITSGQQGLQNILNVPTQVKNKQYLNAVGSGIKGVGQLASIKTPSFNVMNAVSSVPENTIGMNKIADIPRRFSAGGLQGMTGLNLATNVQDRPTNLPVLGKVDLVKTAGNIYGFGENPVNKKLMKVTNGISIPMDNAVGKIILNNTPEILKSPIAKFIINNGVKGGSFQSLTTLADMPTNLSDGQKASYIAQNFLSGGVQQVAFEGAMKGAGKVIGKTSDTLQLAKVYDEMKDWMRKNSTLVNTEYQDLNGKRIKVPMWRYQLKDIIPIDPKVSQSGAIDLGAKVELPEVKSFQKYIDTPVNNEPIPFNDNVKPKTLPKDAITPEEMKQMALESRYKAETENKSFNDAFSEWIGKRDSAKTTATKVSSAFAKIDPKIASEVIQVRENPSAQVSPRAKSIAQELGNMYDTLFADAKKSGVDMNYVDNYITHIWNKPIDVVQQMYKTAKQKFGFSGERSVPTYEEGIRMGLQPKYTHPAQILAEYVQRLEEVKANVAFINKLHDQGLVVPASTGIKNPGFSPINAPGIGRNTTTLSDGKTVVGGWYAPTDIARTINNVFGQQDTGVIGAVASKGRALSGKLQDISLSGGIPGTPLNAFTLAQTQKEIMGGRIASPIKSFIRSLSDPSSKKFFESNVDQIVKMQERNIPITTNYSVESLVPKQTVQRTLGEKLGNIWNTAVNDPTFKRFMPQLQIRLFNDIEKEALKSGKSSSEAADIAASAVKKFYGIIPSDVSARRNKLGQDVLGTVAFAPKFRESMINFWINNAKSISPVKLADGKVRLNNPFSLENKSNTIFVASAIATYAAMDKINYALNGKHMSENPNGTEDKLLIPVGNGNVVGVPYLSSIATIPRGITRQGKMILEGNLSGASKDAFQTYTSTLLKPIADITANQDYFGNAIAKENDLPAEKYKKYAGYIALNTIGAHPYIKEIFRPLLSGDTEAKPLYQRLSQATELPFRFYTDKSLQGKVYYGSRDELLKKTDAKTIQDYNFLHPSKDIKEATIADLGSTTQDKMTKANIRLSNPNVFFTERDIAQVTAQKTGQPIDPLYTAPIDTALRYIRYQSLPPGNADAKALGKAFPQIFDISEARAKFYKEHPIQTQENTTPSGMIPRPIASDRAQQLMDAQQWKDPEVKAYLDANTAWKNQERELLGLTPISSGSSYTKKVAVKKITPKKISMKKLSVKSPKIKKLALSKFKVPKPKKIRLKIKKPRLSYT